MARTRGLTTYIPEDVQRPMRNRLRLLRTSLGINKMQIKTFSSSTMVNYEARDISTFKLADMFSLAKEFGLEPIDFFKYLIGDEEHPIPEIMNRTMQRMNVYMRTLTPEQQQMACDIVRVIVDSLHDRTPTIPSGLPRRDSKSILAQLAEQSR